MAIPTAAQQVKVRGIFKDLYARQLADASAAGKKALALQLLDDAGKVSDAPTDRFVMLAGARHAAIDAGDLESATKADEALCSSFAVDASLSRLDLLARLSKTARTPSNAVAIATAALIESDSAQASGDYNLAHQAAEVAAAAAKGTDDAVLRTTASARAAQTAQTAAAYGRLGKMLAVLQKAPADPDASLAAGRFYCLMVGEWEKGLNYLAAGSNAKLSAAAQADLRAQDPLAIADQWKALAQTEPQAEQQNLQLRAMKWYDVASKTATGIAKLKAQKELAELHAGGADAPGGGAGAGADHSPELPTKPRAVAAIAKYKAVAAPAEAEFQQVDAGFRKQLDTELEAAETQASQSLDTEEANRIRAWKRFVRLHSGAPLTAAELKQQIIDQKVLVYRYGSYGPREMEFLADGRIGAGWGGLEKHWEIAERPHGAVLVLSGDEGPTDFSPRKDGSLAGTWPKGAIFSTLQFSKSDDPSAQPERPQSPIAVAAIKSYRIAHDRAIDARADALSGASKRILAELSACAKEVMKTQDAPEAARLNAWKAYVEAESKRATMPAAAKS